MNTLRTIVRSLLLLLPFALSSCSYTFYEATCPYPETGRIEKIATLPDELVETSGLAIHEDRFLSFNDSGGDPVISTTNNNGELLARTVLKNAVNADWEDITEDDYYFYVADVGNNFGTRDTLVICRVQKDAVLNGIEVADAAKITFSFDEPVSHTSSGLYSHDCEGLFAYGDSLYLFAKDWVALETRVYTMSKEPGYYALKAHNSYPVKALITGADIYPERKEVALVGYRKLTPITIRYSYDTSPALIECGGKARSYPLRWGTQVEGIAFDEQGAIYLTSEKRLRKQALYRAY